MNPMDLFRPEEDQERRIDGFSTRGMGILSAMAVAGQMKESGQDESDGFIPDEEDQERRLMALTRGMGILSAYPSAAT